MNGSNKKSEGQIHSRREFLERTGSGFGMVALSYLLGCEQAYAGNISIGFQNPLAAKPPHFPAKAKSVIYLFMHGGPSHVDTFDPKPALAKFDGHPTPASFGNVFLQFTKVSEAPLMASRRQFQKYGQSGIEISDLFQNVAQHADDLAVVRSCYHDGFTHSNALNWMNNGWPRLGRPSVGSWVVYGLGSQSDNLPAFVVMLQGNTKSGPSAYGSGFLPAMYQGTVLRSTGSPILNIKRPEEIGEKDEREILDLLKWYNQRHLETRREDSDLAARIAAYELSFRMQMAAPELVDLSKESEATRKLYGMDNPVTADYGLKCLLARRMVERGVRFIQLYSGGATGKDWDGHNLCDKNHLEMARTVDKPIAGLLTDLKSRGLLESTLVIWGGEFGRTPMTDGNANGGIGGGRDHNPYGFSIWMAGGGVKGGKVIGATDDIGLQAVSDKVHVHDFHATILGLLGVDHKRLTYFSQGRDFRLSDVGGDHNLTARLQKV
jgi:hypothetical protein